MALWALVGASWRPPQLVSKIWVVQTAGVSKGCVSWRVDPLDQHRSTDQMVTLSINLLLSCCCQKGDAKSTTCLWDRWHWRRTHFWTCACMDLQMNAETSCSKDAVSWSNIQCIYMPFLSLFMLYTDLTYLLSFCSFSPLFPSFHGVACSSFFEGLSTVPPESRPDNEFP